MKNRGFTLIELIAVVVVLGILVVIAAPLVNDIIAGSREQAIQRTAERVEKAAENYVYDNNFVLTLKEGETIKIYVSTLSSYLDNVTEDMRDEWVEVTVINGKFYYRYSGRDD